MAQTKKSDVRDAILEAAFRLFSESGYSDTSLPMIARHAGISPGNIYKYFQSKTDILFTVYEPWLTERLDTVERSLARIADPQRRLERMLYALWRELPHASGGFANNMMQAISSSQGNGDYTPRLRQLFQDRVAGWIHDALAPSRAESQRLAVLVLMAFDGYAMNAHLQSGVACDRATARLMASRLAASRPAAARARKPKASAPSR